MEDTPPTDQDGYPLPPYVPYTNVGPAATWSSGKPTPSGKPVELSLPALEQVTPASSSSHRVTVAGVAKGAAEKNIASNDVGEAERCREGNRKSSGTVSPLSGRYTNTQSHRSLHSTIAIGVGPTIFEKIDESRFSRQPTTQQGFDPTAGPALRHTLPVVVTRDGRQVEERLDPYELARLYGQQQAALRHMQNKYDFLAVPEWVRLHPQLGPYLAEFLGTFVWVLTLSLTSVRNQSIFSVADNTNMTSVPIGFMFTSMIFTFGYISGGHFNPAVSTAVFFIRGMDLAQLVSYILCQLGASVAAGVVAIVIQGSSNIFVPSLSSSYISSGVFSELIFTFAICVVVLNIAYSRQTGNFFYGFAVGMTIAAGSASVGRISGGAFNPAAATGLQLSVCLAGSCDNLKSVWVYWVAPILGAILASLLFSQMAQPMDTQVLEDHKVFVEVSQLQRSKIADRCTGGDARTMHEMSSASSDAESIRSDEDGGRGDEVDDSKPRDATVRVNITGQGGFAGTSRSPSLASAPIHSGGVQREGSV